MKFIFSTKNFLENYFKVTLLQLNFEKVFFFGPINHP